jgi:hypothetical protein
METIETIRNNIAIASTWEIDWSPDAGMFWLTLMVVGFSLTVGIGAWKLERN